MFAAAQQGLEAASLHDTAPHATEREAAHVTISQGNSNKFAVKADLSGVAEMPIALQQNQLASPPPSVASNDDDYLLTYLKTNRGTILNVDMDVYRAEFHQRICTIDFHSEQHSRDARCGSVRYNFPIRSVRDARLSFFIILDYMIEYQYVFVLGNFNISFSNVHLTKSEVNSRILQRIKARLAKEDYWSRENYFVEDWLKDLSRSAEFTVAAKNGLTVPQLREAIRDFKASVEARHISQSAQLVIDYKKSALEGQKPMINLTVVRLRAAFETLIHSVDLDNPHLTEDERVRQAKALAQTYSRLRQRDPTFRDSSDQLRAAQRFLNNRNYRQRKARQSDSPTSKRG